MTGKSSKSKQISLRVPVKLLAQVEGKAAEDGLTRSQEVVRLLRRGLQTDDAAATKADVSALSEAISARLDALEDARGQDAERLAQAIREQPIAVQALPQAEEEQEDWRSKSLWQRIMKR